VLAWIPVLATNPTPEQQLTMLVAALVRLVLFGVVSTAILVGALLLARRLVSGPGSPREESSTGAPDAG